MSQFLLLQAVHPITAAEGLTFDAVLANDHLAEAAAANFRAELGTVWSVADASGGADSLADDAREVLLAGEALLETRLGRFLLEQIEAGRPMCLFWASDFVALPEPEDVPELIDLLTDQLQSDGSWNWELYARWRGAAPGVHHTGAQ